MRHPFYIVLILSVSLHCTSAQKPETSTPAEEEAIKIIQSPTPIEPEIPAETESTEPAELPAEIPAPELPQLLPETNEPKADLEMESVSKAETTDPGSGQPKKPTGPKRLKFPAVDNVLIDPPLPPHPHSSIPSSSGDTTGDIYIAHRSVVEKYNGWGWVKHESESWKEAQWVAVRETLGKVILPGRHLKHPDSDDGMQYRFYGEFSSDTAYEPNKDVFVAVFNLKGFEVIGPASKPSGTTLPKSKTSSATRSKPTTGGARGNPFRR